MDDLTIGNGSEVLLFLKNNSGSLDPVHYGISNNEAELVHMILWIDSDDDDHDLFITRRGVPMQLWKNNGEKQFQNVAEEAGLEQANPG